MASDHAYSEVQRQAIYKVIAERRDMRHFTSEPVDESVLARILQAAHMAPSVGLMQPWRFLRITERALREQIYQVVDREREQTAIALGKRKEEFLKLKVEGILECGELIVAALPDGRERHVFGRRTLPEMDLASLSCAIQNMWLAARAEGIGMGWVSIFDPDELAEVLNMPEQSKPIAVLCIGHVEAFYDQPMLIEENWAQAAPLEQFIYQNRWPDADSQDEEELANQGT